MARSMIGIRQGHQARRHSGQNFLVDDDVVHATVAVTDPKPDGVLVEIGPGLGALAVSLMERVRTPQVIELDRDPVTRLQQRFGDRLVVHAGDALAFDFGLLQEAGRPLRIVGNLPYNISSPLPSHLTTFADHARDQHFMLQKGAVNRMAVAPDSKAFSRLLVMLQVRYYMELILDVSPGPFNPSPKVGSAVVRMIPWPADKSPYASTDPYVFGTVVTMASSQRRRVLYNTLGALRDAIDFEAFGSDLGRCAEEVSVEDLVAVANTLPVNRIAGSASDFSED